MASSNIQRYIGLIPSVCASSKKVVDVEDSRIRVLLALRKELEEELEEVREREDKLQSYINTLNTLIGTTSFTTAELALETTGESTPAPAAASVDFPRTITVTGKDNGLDLATIEVDETDLRVIPAEHALYDIKRGAFARFFVEKILGQYQQEDRHRVENGEIGWDDAFDFEVKAEDGILQEVTIRNYGDEVQLQEIQRTLRWSLEKVYRKR
jgi:hypothetical protein